LDTEFNTQGGKSWLRNSFGLRIRAVSTLLFLLVALFLPDQKALAANLPSDYSTCNDNGYAAAYGASAGCILAIEDSATSLSGFYVNRSLEYCSGESDSITYLRFKNLPRTGQMSLAADSLNFEGQVIANCRTWPGAWAVRVFLTDPEGVTHEAKNVQVSDRYVDCAWYSKCWPHVYLLTTVSGTFDASKISKEGYYKVSVVAQTLGGPGIWGSLYPRSLAAQRDYSNQLWFGQRLAPVSPTPTETPVVPKLTYSTDSRILLGTPTAKSSLTKIQKNQIDGVFVNFSPTKLICTSVSMQGDSLSVKTQRLKLAKAACDYAKSAHPELSVWHQSKITTSKSYSGKILIAFLTPR